MGLECKIYKKTKRLYKYIPFRQNLIINYTKQAFFTVRQDTRCTLRGTYQDGAFRSHGSDLQSGSATAQSYSL